MGLRHTMATATHEAQCFVGRRVDSALEASSCALDTRRLAFQDWWGPPRYYRDRYDRDRKWDREQDKDKEACGTSRRGPQGACSSHGSFNSVVFAAVALDSLREKPASPKKHLAKCLKPLLRESLHRASRPTGPGVRMGRRARTGTRFLAWAIGTDRDAREGLTFIGKSEAWLASQPM